MKLARISSPPVAGDLVDFAWQHAVVIGPADDGYGTRTIVRFDSTGAQESVTTSDLRHRVVAGRDDLGKHARLLPHHRGYNALLQAEPHPTFVGTVDVSSGGDELVLRLSQTDGYIVTGPDHGDTAVLVAERPVIATSEPAACVSGIARMDADARALGIDLAALDLALVRETIHARGPRDDEHIDAIAHVVRALADGKRGADQDVDMRKVFHRITTLNVPSRPACDAVKRVAARWTELPLDAADATARDLYRVWAGARGLHPADLDKTAPVDRAAWRALAEHLAAADAERAGRP